MPTGLSISIQALYSPIAEPLDRVKESFMRIIPPESQILAETLSYALSSGGKYLRPVLTLLCGLATRPLSGTEREESDYPAALIEAAAVTEMIHIATLLHDDVLDEASIRRGKKTVSSQWGNTVSILSGDYLLAQASLKLAQIGNIRLVAIFSQVLSDLCDGEVEQIRTSFQLVDTPDASRWESYLHKSICKTASLFGAGCESAGILNQLPEWQIQQLKTFGQDLGIAFQIMDDLLDYTGTAADLGKPVMDDLKNGLLNAPILLLLDDTPMQDSQLLHQAIQTLFEANDRDPDDIVQAEQTIQSLLETTGTIRKIRDLAEKYVNRSLEAIAFLSESPEKRSLEGLAHFVTMRQN